MADAPPPIPSPSPEKPEEGAARQEPDIEPPPLMPGQRVRLNRAAPYLKSADPMPMLRPPDLVDPGEVGLVVARRGGRQVAVRFRRGTFLLDQHELAVVSDPG